MSALGFKNLKVLRAMFSVPWHPKLIALLMWIVVRYGKDKVIITSAFRKDDPGVHGTIPLRGFDLRSWVFKDPYEITEDINKVWIYDPSRPDKHCCICHDIGRGVHLHLQVHPNTAFIGNGMNKEDNNGTL